MPRATLLVVDDEPNILSTVRRALELEGYTVLVAQSGRAALATVDDCGPGGVDLVLLDVVMPDMSGLEVLEVLRARHRDVVAVMMSGNATIETAVRATRLGARDFLEKPLSTEKLLLTVKNALELSRLRLAHAEVTARTRAEMSMVGSSPAIRAVQAKIEVTAPSSGRVLITGENGTGKELVARALHDGSPRKEAAFIKVNCAAIPSELIESELFGHEKGAFTGATQKRRGKFEQADGGTLFLDEIGDMSASAQAKVLRVLQEGELERVGGGDTIRVDVRVIAATNKDLPAEIAAGHFREDLYYRLNVVPIEVPPLRERREDIPHLVTHFLGMVCAQNGRREKSIAADATTLLMQHNWPGNIRELKNFIERLVILTGEREVIAADDVRAALPEVKAVRGTYHRDVALRDLVAAAERDIILAALADSDYHISNTARALSLERSHLYKKMRALGINPRDHD